MSTYQEQQVRLAAEFEKMAARIKSGKLSLTAKNGRLIREEILRVNPELNNDTITASHMYDAAARIPLELEWDAEPAYVARMREKEKRPNARQEQASTEDFTAKSKNADAAQARAKADEKIVKEIYAIIGAFRPIVNGRERFGLQAEVQRVLTTYIHKSITDTPNVSREDLRTKVKEYIAAQYEKLERASNPVMQ
jgi:hypothetical protein